MKTELFYFAQRGPWAGYWRRVPLQRGIPNLHDRLRDRGHFVREIPA